MKCGQCQASIPDRAKFCPLCGMKQMIQVQASLLENSKLDEATTCTNRHSNSSLQKNIPIPMHRDSRTHSNSSTPSENNASLLGVLSIVSVVIGTVVLQIIFGPAGIILGTIAVNKQNKLGWIGIVLGSIETIAAGLVMFAIANEF